MIVNWTQRHLMNVYIKHEEQSKKRAAVGLTSLFSDIDQNQLILLNYLLGPAQA